MYSKKTSNHASLAELKSATYPTNRITPIAKVPRPSQRCAHFHKFYILRRAHHEAGPKADEDVNYPIRHCH
eukprot:3794131-Amphidinium_carterae.1